MRTSPSAPCLRVLLVLIAFGLACGGSTPAQPPAQNARAFLTDANDTLLRLGIEAARAGWVQQTFITVDTEAMNARASEAFMTAATAFAKRATQYDGVELPGDQRRQLTVLKNFLTMAAPADPKEATELSEIAAALDGMYGRGKYCPGGETGDACLDIEEITEILAKDRNPGTTARGVGRLALDRAADEEGLRTVRGAVQQGRARARVRRHGRHVALQVRHAARCVREGTRPALGAAATAVRVPPHLRPRSDAPALWRRGPCRRSDPRTSARQHLGAGLVQPV